MFRTVSWGNCSDSAVLGSRADRAGQVVWGLWGECAILLAINDEIIGLVSSGFVVYKRDRPK